MHGWAATHARKRPADNVTHELLTSDHSMSRSLKLKYHPEQTSCYKIPTIDIPHVHHM